MPIPWQLSTVPRPNRLAEDKGRDYHLQFARYCSNTLTNPIISDYYWRIWRNRLFCLGGDGQWIMPDDLIPFFEDSDGQARGRVRFCQNIIRPFVNTLMDEARKMSLSFKAQAQGDGVINRREKELGRMKVFRQLADQAPEIEESLKKFVPIGRNTEETEEIFKNVWTDPFEKTINNLCKYIAEENELDTVLRDQATKSLALTGLATFKNESKGRRMYIKSIDSGNFFWDAGAERFDLRDAEFMGDTEFAIPTDLFEYYDLDEQTKKDIERYTQYLPVSAPTILPLPYSYAYLPGRLPVVYVEWKDTERWKYGYVKDQYGYDYFTRVYPDNYKMKSNERCYYEKDLIYPAKEQFKTYMNGKLFKWLDKEIIRYCRFTPSEIYTGGEGHDIVYEYGIVPHQECYALNPTDSEFSYRCTTWQYEQGIVSTPVDDIIDPQRLINRANSIAEAAMNKYTTGTVIDMYATKGMDMTEEELQRKVERGDTVVIDSKGMGANQAASSYGNNTVQGAQALKMIANEYVQNAAQMIGQMTVSPKASKKAVLGAEEQEQSLHGQYLARIEDLMRQEYQCISNKGRRIYANADRRLAIMVGDKGVQEIVITQDLQLEDFRMFTRRADDEKQSKTAADMAMTQYLQMGLITEIDLANAFGRTTLDQVGEVIRQSLARKQTAQKAADQEKEKQNQLNQMLSQANMERMELQKKKEESIALSEAEKDRMIKLDTIIARIEGQMKRDAAKHEQKMKELETVKK